MSDSHLSSRDLFEEVHTLVMAELAGELNESKQAQLERLVCTRADARQLYVRYLSETASLRWWAGHTTESDVAVEPHPGPVLTTWSTKVIRHLASGWASLGGASRVIAFGISGLLTIYFALLVFAVVWDQVNWAHRADERPGSPVDLQTVAVISDATDAKWSDRSTPRPKNAAIQQGEPLRIESGTMELDLNAGTKLVVEGPADWSVDGKNSVSLRAGKLLATVPTQAVGFSVKTPTAKIVDLGTEFGVEVDNSQNTDVYVLKGEVLAEPPGQAVAKNQEVRLSAGRAIRLTTSGEVIQRTESESTAIATTFSNLFRKKESGAHDESAKSPGHGDQRAHARLLSLFPFDGSPTNFVVGAADGTLEGGDGPNPLPRYVAGKIGAKGLDFDGVDDRVNATIYGYPKASLQGRPSNGLEKGSAAFWIKTTESKEGYVLSNFEGNTAFSLIANYGNAPGQLLVYLRTSSLSILQMHLAEPENVWRNGEWHHVVMTWNVTTGAAGTGNGAFWIDGMPKPVSFMFNNITSNIKFDPWTSQSVLIGAGSQNGATGHFVSGSLDDFGIWNDQLGGLEVKALYNLGNDPVLNYNARNIQIVLDVFAKGPGAKGRTSDGRTWSYATELAGDTAEVINDHTAVVLDADKHTGVEITSDRKETK
jgi:hypothetical protein